MSLEQSLNRCAETLATRFPSLERDIIDRCVRRIYEQLRAQATITDHLFALTQRHAAEELATLAADSHPTTEQTRPD